MGFSFPLLFLSNIKDVQLSYMFEKKCVPYTLVYTVLHKCVILCILQSICRPWIFYFRMKLGILF
jgi:hypothetical protein